jgi:hypothetical protein
MVEHCASWLVFQLRCLQLHCLSRFAILPPHIKWQIFSHITELLLRDGHRRRRFRWLCLVCTRLLHLSHKAAG